MIMKLRFGIALATVLALFSTAAPARADITLTPYIGALFSGDLPTAKAAYGVSLAAMGKGIFGAEFDFSWTPNFVDATPISAAVTEANLAGNLIVGIPIGGTHGASVRPYVVGGGGLLRATAKQSDFLDRLTSNDFAWDFGGGVMGTFNGHIGLRADLRYFRTNNGSNAYKFWRGTGGLALKF
jgi:Outer membrane protein beta-barrel domain